jgi:hypothetical protein
MKIIDVSDGKVNYSQRNNEVRPYSSCNTTSLTMGTSYNKKLWDLFIASPVFLRYKQFEQPEDRLQQALLDWGLDPTNHFDLMKGYNKFIGKDIDTFSTSFPFNALVDDLLSGRAWIGSGTFPGYPKLNINKKTGKAEALGHIVCVVGLMYEEDPYKPIDMIIDDPYGNTMSNWSGSGNNVYIPWDLFVKWMKPVNNPAVFWAHRFTESL